MVSRKRRRDEVEAEEAQEAPAEPTTLQKLRNMWQFASLMQYIYIFGKTVKIEDEVDIELLERECLRPEPSQKLTDIGLALLKYVSSHKGLTIDLFDEYTRRQYVAKAPQRNPFGEDEEPKKFAEFDVFQKIRVLHQLSTWTLYNPNRIREKMDEKKDLDQTEWRMEPLGWDEEDRAYFLLDDDRIYRRTDPPPPLPPTKKTKAKPKKRGTRASKRRKTDADEVEEDVDDTMNEATLVDGTVEDDEFGGMKWECIAITPEEHHTLVARLGKSKDPNTRVLHERIVADVMPYVEYKAEQEERNRLKKEKELENLQKMASAKRSSRIAGKMLKQREDEEAAEAERIKQKELIMAQKEQEKQQKMEQERQSRMMTREQRLKEREVKRALHEEELRKLQEAGERAETEEARQSERHRKAELLRRQQELEKLQQEEENWIFDCSVCGVHGENLDDGSHSIACERCNVWQHSACHGIPQTEAEKDDFHFVCEDCKRKEEEAKKPKLPPLKFKLASPDANRTSLHPPAATLDSVQIPIKSDPVVRPNQPPQQVVNEQNGRNPDQHFRPTPNLNPFNLPKPHVGTGAGLFPAFPRPAQSIGQPPQQFSAVPSPSETTGTSFQPNCVAPGSPSKAASAPRQLDSVNGSPAGLPTSSKLGQVLFSPKYPATLSSPPPLLSSPPHTNGQFGGPINPTFTSPSASFPPSGAAASAKSPVKHSSPVQPQTTPRAISTFSTPVASFPPARPSSSGFSPVKNASPPPAPILPSPMTGISPEKHDGPRPVSSHSLSETPIFPPSTSLSPSSKAPILTPPTKKMTPKKPSPAVNVHDIFQ